MELIHTEEREGFTIRTYALPEDISPIGQFDSGGVALDQEIIDDIAAGNLTWFMAKVTASKNGIALADSYLGACCYKSHEGFIKDSGYYEDMVSEVIAEAKTAIKLLIA